MFLRQTLQQPRSKGLLAAPEAPEDEDGDSRSSGVAAAIFDEWPSPAWPIRVASLAKQRVLSLRNCLLMLSEVLC